MQSNHIPKHEIAAVWEEGEGERERANGGGKKERERGRREGERERGGEVWTASELRVACV